MKPLRQRWDLSHMQRTKGEAINSGVSVTVEEGHSKWSSQVQRLHCSSQVLHKQYSRFSILQHHGRRKPGPHSCVLGKCFQNFIPSSTERLCVAHRLICVCYWMTSYAYWSFQMPAVQFTSSYEYIGIYSLHGAPQAKLGPKKKHGR